MSKYKVVIPEVWGYPTEIEDEVLRKIDSQVVVIPCETEEEIIKASEDADALLIGKAKITRPIMAAMKKCRVVVRYGIGLDTLDIKAATDHGIYIANVPDFCIDEVSDTAMGLILATTRKIAMMSNRVKEGNWDRGSVKPIYRLRGSVLGIIAFGNIGQKVALKAYPFGFKIIVHDPYLSSDAVGDYPIELVDLETLLRESDVVSIHSPLNQETRHLISEAELRMMKDSAFLINTARGPIVDEKALYRALKEGWIAGAGLDVLEVEPPEEGNPLLGLDNLVITPHYASYTEESSREVRVKAAENIVATLREGYPTYPVNPGVKDKYMTRWESVS